MDIKELKDFITRYKKENCPSSCADTECPCSWDVDGSFPHACLLEIIAINIDKISDM